MSDSQRQTEWSPQPGTVLLIRSAERDVSWRIARDCDSGVEAKLYIYPRSGVVLIRRGGIEYVYSGKQAAIIDWLAKTGHVALPLIMLGRMLVVDIGEEC